MGKEHIEIEDLAKAYEYAKLNKLSEKNFFAAHKILSKSFLIRSKQGKYRDDQIGVYCSSGPVYLAVEPEFVKEEMDSFWEEYKKLVDTNLTDSEKFYFASFFHLRLVQIHPFFDGNGRIARLFEKWFLADQFGERAWNIESEKYYKENRQKYYDSINLGVNFYELDFNLSLQFLSLLPDSLKQTEKN